MKPGNLRWRFNIRELAWEIRLPGKSFIAAKVFDKRGSYNFLKLISQS